MIRCILRHLLLGLRPLLGPQARCKYPVSCTAYALEQLKHEKLHRMFWNVTKRLLSCNPFT